MGIRGTRKFKRLSEDTILLDDTTYAGGKPVRKKSW